MSNSTFTITLKDAMSSEEYNDMVAFEEFAKHRSIYIWPDTFGKSINWQNQEIVYEDSDVQDLFDSFRAGARKHAWLPDEEAKICHGIETEPAGVVIGPQIIVRTESAGVDMLSPVVDAEFDPPDFEEVPPPPPTPPERMRSPTTRALTRHIAPGMPHNLLVQVNDPVTIGGASYSYEIVLPDGTPFLFEFQSQEPELGINGITMEALLVVCIDRLEAFQKGPYPCRENALALTKIEEALLWLHRRTERLALDEEE